MYFISNIVQMNIILNVSYIYIYIIVLSFFQCTFTCMFYVSIFRAVVYMYICIFIYLSIYWKSGTSDLMVLMLFVLQCTDYKQNVLTLTLTGDAAHAAVIAHCSITAVCSLRAPASLKTRTRDVRRRYGSLRFGYRIRRRPATERCTAGCDRGLTYLHIRSLNAVEIHYPPIVWGHPNSVTVFLHLNDDNFCKPNRATPISKHIENTCIHTNNWTTSHDAASYICLIDTHMKLPMKPFGFDFTLPLSYRNTMSISFISNE